MECLDGNRRHKGTHDYNLEILSSDPFVIGIQHDGGELPLKPSNSILYKKNFMSLFMFWQAREEKKNKSATRKNKKKAPVALQGP